MKNTTRTGTVHRARSADVHETRRYVSGAAWALIVVASVALIAVLVYPPLIGVIQ